MIPNAETCERFLKACDESYTPESVGAMRRGLESLGEYLNGEWARLDYWSEHDVERYRSHLLKLFKPTTAALYAEFVLGCFLRFLGRREIVANIERVYRTRTHNNTQLGLPSEPLEAIVQLVPMDSPLHVRNRVILELLLKTGPKPGELKDTLVRDVDFREALIRYHHWNTHRSVPLDDVLCEIIAEYVSVWRPMLISGSDPGHLLLTRRGNALNRTDVWRTAVNHLSDVDGVNPTQLRHEFIRRRFDDDGDRDGMTADEIRHRVTKLAGLSHVSQTYVYEDGKYRGGRPPRCG